MSKTELIDAEKLHYNIKLMKLKLEKMEKDAREASKLSVNGKIPLKCLKTFLLFFKKGKYLDDAFEESWPDIREAYAEHQSKAHNGSV